MSPGCDNAKLAAGVFQSCEQFWYAVKRLHHITVLLFICHPEINGFIGFVRDAEIIHIPFGSTAEDMPHILDLRGGACDGEKRFAQRIKDTVSGVKKGSVYIENNMFIFHVHNLRSAALRAAFLYRNIITSKGERVNR